MLVMAEPRQRITLTRDGPILVFGGLPLEEKIIATVGRDYVFEQGRVYETKESYALCRCGHSKAMPFCDGSHKECRYRSNQNGSRQPYLKNAKVFRGGGLAVTDNEDLCAFSRFCHSNEGDIWTLLEQDDPALRELVIKLAAECPAGRLVAWDEATNTPIEPDLPPSLVILQDPERGVSGPLWVRGGIPIQGEDGFVYEIRNRVTLCRCGHSDNMPFCDAYHISYVFRDNKK